MSTGIRATSDGLSGALQVGGTDVLFYGSDTSGQLTGFRNKIINGSFKLDQRNAAAAQTITAAAALAYTVDRWYVYCTGANVTSQQIVSSAENRLRITGAASNTLVGIGQRIESFNCMDLAGKMVTLSCKLSSTSLTTITWTSSYANSADTFGTLASPTKTQIATGTFTITSTETKYFITFAVPTAAVTGIDIVFTTGALLGSQTLIIGDVQLEKGTVSTDFEVRPIGLERLLCCRYYEFGYFNWTMYQQAGSGYTSLVPFSTPKRVAPSLGTVSTASLNTTNPGITGTVYGISHQGSATALGVCQYYGYYTASAEL